MATTTSEVIKEENYVECYKCGEETLDHPEVNFCQHCLAHL